MRVARAQVVAMLILALIFGALQCTAACAADDCNSALPPCHQHEGPSHGVTAACPHDFLLPDTKGPERIQLATFAFGAPVVRSAHLQISSEIRVSPAFSPPAEPPSSSSILRL